MELILKAIWRIVKRRGCKITKNGKTNVLRDWKRKQYENFMKTFFYVNQNEKLVILNAKHRKNIEHKVTKLNYTHDQLI